MAVTKRCEVCGNEFRTTKSTQRTCSLECRGRARRSRVTLVCAHCGKDFEVTAAIAGRSRFCSYQCYWESGGPAKNAPRKPNTGVARYARVYLGRDEQGKPRYIQRSHAVWNQHHPDDPVQPGEHVHHIDRDTHNDDISNLVKLPGRAHARLHAASITDDERKRRAAIAAPKSAAANRKGAPRICPICGTEFYRPPSASQVTCSYRCSGLWSAQQRKRKE